MKTEKEDKSISSPHVTKNGNKNKNKKRRKNLDLSPTLQKVLLGALPPRNRSRAFLSHFPLYHHHQHYQQYHHHHHHHHRLQNSNW